MNLKIRAKERERTERERVRSAALNAQLIHIPSESKPATSAQPATPGQHPSSSSASDSVGADMPSTAAVSLWNELVGRRLIGRMATVARCVWSAFLAEGRSSLPREQLLRRVSGGVALEAHMAPCLLSLFLSFLLVLLLCIMHFIYCYCSIAALKI